MKFTITRFNLVLTIFLSLIASLQTYAQFFQQGGKLVGTVDNAYQGTSVAFSADGNTAIVGGVGDGNGVGAAWVWSRSGGVWSQQGSKLVGSGAVGAPQQGFSVALSADGNTAIVGGPRDNGGRGAAWVWTRSGGVWTQQGSKLVGTGAMGGIFGGASQGYSVALSADGNTAIVGGPYDSSSSGIVGAAWVWTRSGGVWTQQGSKRVGTGALTSAGQGNSVSLSADGNTAIIGGPYDNNGAGAVWVWTRSGSVWTQQGSKLVGTGAIGAAGQGNSISLSSDGNTAIVSGYRDNSNTGAAWVWTRSGSVWTQQGGKLVGMGAFGPALQGISASLSSDGNTAIIGGYGDNSSTGANGAGAVWVWTRSGGVWTQQGNKLVGTGVVGDTARQGISVSLSADGNSAIVGGYHDNSNTGAAWVWTRTGGVWTQQGSKLVGTGADGGTPAWQGESVAISSDGNTAIVGGGNYNSKVGAAWVWTRSGSVWTQQGRRLIGTGAVGAASQGQSVSLSSDGNTAIVGGPYDNGFQGAAWVWTRSGGVWTQQGNKLVGTGAVGTTAYQGRSVALSSDGNTAIIGGNGDNGNTGAVWVWTRSGGVWTQQGSKLIGTGAVGAARQGTSVSLSSDGNTAIVGGPNDSSSAGAVWVWMRTGGTWTQQGGKLVGTGAVGTTVSQGTSVALSSDGNTAIVGGDYDNGGAGAAWVWTRAGGVWTQQGDKLVGTGAVNVGTWSVRQGSSVSLSNDGNTAIVGGPIDNRKLGAAWVWTRSGAVWTQLGSKLIGTGSVLASPGDPPSLYQGASVALSSDGNTAIVGGPSDSNETGAVWIFSKATAAPSPPTLISPAQNATGIPTSTNLTWNPSSQAASYRVQLSTNSSFTTLIINDSTLTTTARAGGPLTINTVYYWRVNAKNAIGTSPYLATWSFTSTSVGVLPNTFALQRLNLEKGKFLRFSLPQKAHVVIQLFNSQGRMVSQLLDETRDAGYYTLPLSGEAQGAYFLDFRAGDFHKTIPIH